MRCATAANHTQTTPYADNTTHERGRKDTTSVGMLHWIPVNVKHMAAFGVALPVLDALRPPAATGRDCADGSRVRLSVNNRAMKLAGRAKARILTALAVSSLLLLAGDGHHPHADRQGGAEYCGNVETHDHELYRAVNGIEHTRGKVRHPQRNGMCERFHKTVLNGFCPVAFRRKLYHLPGDLQTDTDAWREGDNTNRTHQGRMCRGPPCKPCAMARPSGRKRSDNPPHNKVRTTAHQQNGAKCKIKSRTSTFA